MDPPTCRFCAAPAWARYRLSRGCVVYPDDRTQDLCTHHAMRASPLDDATGDGFRRIAEYVPWPWGDRSPPP